jgi:hypothetical protein
MGEEWDKSIEELFSEYDPSFVKMMDDIWEEQKKKREEVEMKEYKPTDFLFAGQRVILNPEGRNFEGYNNQAQGNAGYVISHRASDQDLNVILTNPNQHIPNWNLEVEWDNGVRNTYKVKDLLKVENNFKSIQEYYLSNGDRIPVLTDKDMQKVDERIIKFGARIRKHRTFTEDWVKEKVDWACRELSS